jgi:hypothetical protein
MKTPDSPVVRIKEQLKPKAEKATKKTGKLIRGLSYDAHPLRTKIINGLWFAIPGFFTGAMTAVRWMRRKS